MQNAKCKMQIEKCGHALSILHFALCTLHFALLPWRHWIVCRDGSRGAASAANRRRPRRHCRSLQGRAVDPGGSHFARRQRRRLRATLSVIVPDGDGVPSRVSTPPERALPPRARPGDDRAAFVPLRPGREHALGRTPRGRNDWWRRKPSTTAAAADVDHFLPALEFQELIVTVGPSALGVEEAGKLAGVESEFRPVAAQVDDVRQLPTDWCGYEGVDAVILSTSRPEIYRQLTSDGVQMKALDQWVHMGGRLALCVGAASGTSHRRRLRR